MQKMLFHFSSVLYHMFFHFPVSDYGTQTAILPVMMLAAYAYCFFPLSSRTCCHTFTIITLRSTNIEKSNRNLLHVGDLSQCQPAGGWKPFLLVLVVSCLAAPRRCISALIL